MANLSKKNSELLNFRVSSGLKRIIGRDLITNDFVAVFELVKNAFDAQATRVDLFFDEDSLYIIDNGKGMTHEDIINKWLFVAYSAKKDGTEDPDYRDKIKDKKAYAGSKGVGRFSCDRLGSYLKMQSRHQASGPLVEVIEVNWDRFEQNDKEDFLTIPLENYQTDQFELPKGVKEIDHGTTLHIQGFRGDSWDRTKLLDLKSSLAKLINPFEEGHDDFTIHIHAPKEKNADSVAMSVAQTKGEPYDHKIVNGKVKNFIFKNLSSKTTKLEVSIVDDGSMLESKLTDRGELIFHVKEPNPYGELVNSGFSCHLFYLNRSAKTTFTRQMGVHSVAFGSVFLFRNGFRVFPVGEQGDDSFDIDHRKQQGYARYLGTRDLVGRIDVTGSEDDFKESTSRDQGLVETPAYKELQECFWEKCLRRLERYVVGVAWKVPADSFSEDISKLSGDKTKARVIEMLAKLTDSESVELLNYSKSLIGILNEKSDDFEKSIEELRLVAEKTENPTFIDEISKAEKRYRELKKAEEEARIAAELEREAREKAEKQAKRERSEREKAEEERDKAKSSYVEEKKRNLFLSSVNTLDYDIILNLHHQIGIYSADINNLIAINIDKIRHNESISTEELLSLLEQLAFRNQKVLSVSRFATKANFRLDSEAIRDDLVAFISQYIQEICVLYSGDGLDITINSDTSKLVKDFKPIEISMLVDNLVSNARKAGATRVSFQINQKTVKEIEIIVEDNGRGFDPETTEPKRIFEKGYTTTDGSGLGLYHVAYMIDQMGGGIEVDETHQGGAKIMIRLRA